MSQKTILLIDDDTLFLMLTKKLLGKQPFLERISTATTLEEAFSYFQELKEQNSAYPDAVFIDLDMPQMDGLELAQQLKESYLADQSQTKIFILSSSISQRDRQTAENMPIITDYMEKPLSAETLKGVLGLQNPEPKDRESMHGSKNKEWQKGEGTTRQENQ